MNYLALSLASLLSVSMHSAVLLSIKPNHQPALQGFATYRPIVGISIVDRLDQQASVSSAISVQNTNDSFSSVKANEYSSTTSLNESFEKNEHVDIESESELTGQAPTDLNATPKISWSLNTESISEAQVVTMVLQLTINKTGEIDDYFVLESTASKEQTDNILKDFRSTSFVPFTKDGKPASHTMIVEIKVDNMDSFSGQKTEQR